MKDNSNSFIEKDKFYDKHLKMFHTEEHLKIHPELGENIKDPKYSFTQAENIIEGRIKMIQDRLYDFITTFNEEKKRNKDIITDAECNLGVMHKEAYFEIKGNFENLNDKINEQKSLNLLNQKQITALKKEKNEKTLEMNKLHERLNKIEDVLGINLKDKKDKI